MCHQGVIQHEQLHGPAAPLDATYPPAYLGDDPRVREIGSGIADGTLTWRTVATHSAYSEDVFRGSVLKKRRPR